ncbi:hypothetical protein VP01_142g5 [Puccinia sorghi]|uniref:Uncharacterized protein n=1 Tax=Puccinia sorghi TaxID=27349 RepID=A0A0L6VM92_9BASI|nr:hypothetical protein VP01_142g5 [Puccinia sorghi]
MDSYLTVSGEENKNKHLPECLSGLLTDWLVITRWPRAWAGPSRTWQCAKRPRSLIKPPGHQTHPPWHYAKQDLGMCPDKLKTPYHQHSAQFCHNSVLLKSFFYKKMVTADIIACFEPMLTVWYYKIMGNRNKQNRLIISFLTEKKEGERYQMVRTHIISIIHSLFFQNMKGSRKHCWMGTNVTTISGGLAVFDDLFRNFFFREERPSSFEKQALQYYYIRGREGEKLSKNHKKRDGLVDQMKGIRVGGMDGSKVNMYNIDKDD